MDQETLDKVRADLESEREQQLETLKDFGADPYSDEVKNLDFGGMDGFADSGQMTEQRSEALAEIDAARTRVHQIDRALEMMDEGSYGVCEVCGDDIQAARLEVRPLSVRCVDCASKA